MDNSLIEKYNLPGYIKGKSFAKASELIDSKFKDREDPTSLKTKQMLLERLAAAQEEVRAGNAGATPSLDEVEQMFLGGFNPADMAGAMPYLQGAQMLTSMVPGKEGKALQGAASGAQLGALAGPAGAIVGGAIGGVTSLVGANKQEAERTKFLRDHNPDVAATAHLRSEFATGGSIDGLLADPFADTPVLGTPEMATPEFVKPESAVARGTQVGNFLRAAGDWAGDNAGNILQYAPILGNINELNKVTPPNNDRGTRLDRDYSFNDYDFNLTLNEINDQNVNAAAREASGGNLGAYQDMLRATHLNKLRAKNQAVQAADQANFQRDDREFGYEASQDRINASLDQAFIDRRDANNAAYENTKSNLRQQIFSDVGDIGREVINRRQVRDMFGYTWDGKYFVDKEGNKYTNQEVMEMRLAKENKKNKDGQ